MHCDVESIAVRRAAVPAALTLLLALVALPSPASARAPRSPQVQHAAPRVPAAATVPAAPAPVGVAAMRISIDPETGALAPLWMSAGLYPIDGDEPALDRSTDGLIFEQRPDGSRHVNLQGRFMEYTMFTVLPDGRGVFHCADGHPSAANLLLIPPPAPSAALPVK